MTSAQIKAENAQLRAQLAALEERLMEQERAASEQRAHLEAVITERSAQARILKATLNSIADGLAIADREGNLSHVNARGDQILGKSIADRKLGEWGLVCNYMRADQVTPYQEEELPLARALGGELVTSEEMFVYHELRPEGFWVNVSACPIRAEDGTLEGAVAVFRDISERKQWERALEEQIVREREKSDALERLRSAVMELSTPILEVWDDVLALPVIGILDSRRSAEMMERLLEAVEVKQCRFVIIDITGVEVVDSATADRLLKLVNAVEIIGARCMLTGARGAVAQTLVSIGANLGSLLTLRNLKHGLRECLAAMEQPVRRRPPPRAIEAPRRLVASKERA